MNTGTSHPEQSSERARISDEALVPIAQRRQHIRGGVNSLELATRLLRERNKQAELAEIQGAVGHIVNTAITTETPKNPLFDNPDLQGGDASNITQSREDIAAIFAEAERRRSEAND